MRGVHDAKCSRCGGKLLTDGRRSWCPAVVRGSYRPGLGGEPCGYRLRGGIDRADRWSAALMTLMARVKAAEWRARNRFASAARRHRGSLNLVEQVP